MIRICRHIPTNRIIEMQSDAIEGTLLDNAVASGYIRESCREETMTEEEWHALTDPTPEELDAIRMREAQRNADLDEILPSWDQVQTAIGNIANLLEAKAFLLKLARVLYWIVRGRES